MGRVRDGVGGAVYVVGLRERTQKLALTVITVRKEATPAAVAVIAPPGAAIPR